MKFQPLVFVLLIALAGNCFGQKIIVGHSDTTEQPAGKFVDIEDESGRIVKKFVFDDPYEQASHDARTLRLNINEFRKLGYVEILEFTPAAELGELIESDLSKSEVITISEILTEYRSGLGDTG